MPVDQKELHELHKLVRHAGLKIDSSAGKALETEIANLKNAYADVMAHRHERAKRRLRPLRDIARHAAAVANKLDQMTAFKALVRAIADVAERDEFIRRESLESAPDDLKKLSGGPLGPTAFSFVLLPKSLRSFSQQAKTVQELIAAPARRPGRRPVETWRRKQMAYELRRCLARHAPRVNRDSAAGKKWLAAALEFCGCKPPAWNSSHFKKFLIDDEPEAPKRSR
jgi:hypothetical protein